MIKHPCTVSTNAERGTHGDCFRACIASILDIEYVEDVPDYNGDIDTAMDAMNEWLLARGYALAFIGVDNSLSLAEVHGIMMGESKHAYYMLIGENAHHEVHCAIYRNGQLIHDPAWFPSPIVRAPFGSDWHIVVVTYVGLCR